MTDTFCSFYLFTSELPAPFSFFGKKKASDMNVLEGMFLSIYAHLISESGS